MSSFFDHYWIDMPWRIIVISNTTRLPWIITSLTEYNILHCFYSFHSVIWLMNPIKSGLNIVLLSAVFFNCFFVKCKWWKHVCYIISAKVWLLTHCLRTPHIIPDPIIILIFRQSCAFKFLRSIIININCFQSLFHCHFTMS